MTRRKFRRPFKRPGCVAIPYLSQWRSHGAGGAGGTCGLPAHGELEGHPLCWTHYVTASTRATLAQVLAGRR